MKYSTAFRLVWGLNVSLLDAVREGEAARQRPSVLHLTLLTVIELTDDDENFLETAEARQDFPQSIATDSVKGFGQVTKAAYIPLFCSLHFFCICLSMKIMSTVSLLGLNPHRLSGVFSCAIVGLQQDASKDFGSNGD